MKQLANSNIFKTSASIFLRPGVCFFPVLYFLLESLSETTGSFMGRPILSRQKRFGFYRPTAFCIANAITDIPVVMFQVTCFSIILYFMAALQMDAGKFFTFWIIIIVQTLCFIQLFRAVGAVCKTFGNASKISGLLSTVFFVYGGKSSNVINCIKSQLTGHRISHSIPQDARLVPLDLLPQSGRLCI